MTEETEQEHSDRMHRENPAPHYFKDEDVCKINTGISGSYLADGRYLSDDEHECLIECDACDGAGEVSVVDDEGQEVVRRCDACDGSGREPAEVEEHEKSGPRPAHP